MPWRLQPTSPSVLIDTAEGIVQLAFMSASIRGDDPLVIETIFEDSMGAVQIRFWVLPSQAASHGAQAGQNVAGFTRRGA